MKTLFAGFAAALVMSGAAVAQEQTVAAGRIQNTFDASGRPAAVAVPETPGEATAAPDPRAEPAIRAFIGGLQTGTVDWNVFTPNMADQLRPNEAAMVEVIRGLGALESVDWFQNREGVDMFLVRFADADTQWLIGFDEGEKIAALLFRPAPPIAQGADAR